jgi:hypothetical protein
VGFKIEGIDEALAAIEKMAARAAKLGEAGGEGKNLEEFRAAAGLRRRPRRSVLYAKKEDAELAAKSEEDRAFLEEQEALGDDVADFIIGD